MCDNGSVNRQSTSGKPISSALSCICSCPQPFARLVAYLLSRLNYAISFVGEFLGFADLPATHDTVEDHRHRTTSSVLIRRNRARAYDLRDEAEVNQYPCAAGKLAMQEHLT